MNEGVISQCKNLELSKAAGYSPPTLLLQIHITHSTCFPFIKHPSTSDLQNNLLIMCMVYCLSPH